MKDFFNKETLDNIKQFCAENKKTAGFVVKPAVFMVAGEGFEPRIIVAAIEISLRLQAFYLCFLRLKILYFGGRK